MSLLSITAAKAQRNEPIFTAEISPPRLYLEIDRIVGIARQLRAVGLDAIAVTNSTGGSYKFSPWAIIEDIQAIDTTFSSGAQGDCVLRHHTGDFAFFRRRLDQFGDGRAIEGRGKTDALNPCG